LTELVRLARDKSKVSRAKLSKAMDAVAGSGDGDLTPEDRFLMDKILHSLVLATEEALRRALVAQLSQVASPSAAAMGALLDSEVELAFPLLAQSKLLQDAELIEVVQYRAIEYQLTLAMRSLAFSPSGSARPQASVATAAQTATETETNAGGALPAEMARRLYWGVAAAIRKAIAAQVPDGLDAFDDAVEAVMLEGFGPSLGDAVTLARESAPSGRDGDADALLELLRAGRVAAFIEALADRARLRQQLICRMLFEEGGEGLATTCKALGLSKHFFITAFLLCRDGRLGDKQVPEREAEQAIAFYDSLNVGTALRLLRHWRRDQCYLNALRVLDEPLDEPRAAAGT
jgi:hypothetical protein